MNGDDLKLELEQARHAIRDLQGELNRTNSELLQLTVELDDRVAQRTVALREANQRLELDISLQTLRGKVLQMRNEGDWDGVALLFHEHLGSMVESHAIGINVVDLVSDSYIDHYTDSGGLRRDFRTPVVPAIKQAMHAATPIYRRNREEMTRLGDPPHLAANGICSVLDVPFSSGTVAINSTREGAFGDWEIEILTRFAQVMSEAHHRLQDLRDLAQAEQRVTHVQRLEMVSDLAAGIAHQINNPLTSVIGYSQMLLKLDLPAPVGERLDLIRQEGERAQAISQRLLDFARARDTERQALDLNELVDRTLSLLRFRLQSQDIPLVQELSPGLPLVDAAGGELQQLLTGLVYNSREAFERCGRQGRILVRTSTRDQRVFLSVEDDGPGIPEPDLYRVFQPFYTTGELDLHTGLGLAFGHAVARAHGGDLRAEPRSAGACLVLDLPALTDTDCTQAPPGQSGSAVSSGRHQAQTNPGDLLP